MHFKKMNGLGNDFVILDRRTQDFTLSVEETRHICNRETGVGCDQLVIMQVADGDADVRAEFFNSDGSVSAACGNATRCVAHIIMKETGEDSCRIETDAGILSALMVGDLRVKVDMGEPVSIETLDIAAGPIQGATGVNMGNPHCVFFVDDVKAIPVRILGPKVENDPLFPQRTNVEFVQVLDKHRVRQRTWERGAGETLACGSGACAVAVAAIHTERTGRNVAVILDGGRLDIEWRADDNHVFMTGPVEYEFEGQLAL